MTIHVDPSTPTWQVTPDMLGVLDATGVFKNVNYAWFTILGRMPSEIESRQFFDFVHPDDIARTAEAFEEIQTGKPILKFENRYRHKDGSYRWLSWNAVPENGLFVCNARDVTAEKENAATLETRADEARLREQFVGVLGHDLRNPIAAIDAAFSLLSMDAQTDSAREAIGWGQEAVGRMNRLINDITDFARSRLGEGLVVNKVADVQLEAVVRQVVEEIRLANPDRDIRQNFDLGGACSCDPDRISQMLSNLVANSVAHGAPDQPITVSGVQRNGAIILQVENGGDPIPASAMAQLFEPFSRTDGHGSQAGLGLGLFIAKQIADGHGGDLSVRSDAISTTFTFEMPNVERQRNPIELIHCA